MTSIHFSFETNPPAHILVVSQRYLGDTLLLTPLLSSLRQAYPLSKVDVLLPACNHGMLENNPDVSDLLSIPNKSDFWRFIGQLVRLYHRYDLAISTQTSDRATIYAAIAGKVRIGQVPAKPKKGWWKRFAFNAWLEFNLEQNHALLGNLNFCRLLNIPPCYSITLPRAKNLIMPMPISPFVVMHIMPQWHYKQWHRQGWIDVAAFLHGRGYHVVLTGSGQPDEQTFLTDIANQFSANTLNLAGQLSLAQLTPLIEQAELFIGPDTGITHLAASTGTKTLAIFGPTSPIKWGPWPKGYTKHCPPFVERGSQQIGNVSLIQGTTDKGCMPCQNEGCEKKRSSHSECLDKLSADSVIAIISEVLDSSRG